MCVYNILNKQALFKLSDLFYKVATCGFMNNNDLPMYYKPTVNFLFAWQDEIKPQLPVLINDTNFFKFISYSMERLDKLRKFEQSLDLPLEEKNGEIPEEEKKIIKQVIEQFHIKYNTLGKIKPESMNIFHNSLNAGWRCWQTLQEEHNKYSYIFDPYVEDFQIIENYKKKLEKCKYYKGFYFHSIGKWKFIINDIDKFEIFTHESLVLCLEQKEKNIYFPYKYLFLCIDFQMQGGGASEKEAFEELKSSFNFYFQNIFKKSDNVKVISEIVKNKNIWKDAFIELFNIAENKRDVKKMEFMPSYRCMINKDFNE